MPYWAPRSLTDFLRSRDYDGFRTARMNFPQATTDQMTATCDDRTRWASSGPAVDSLYVLRRVLYKLKDSVSNCQVAIDAYAVHMNGGHTSTIPNQQRSLWNIKDTLSNMLTNNASDWIEDELAGTFTYHNFCRLDSETIRAVSIQLDEIARALNDVCTLFRRGGWNRENLEMEIEMSELASLGALLEILDGMFSLQE